MTQFEVSPTHLRNTALAAKEHAEALRQVANELRIVQVGNPQFTFSVSIGRAVTTWGKRADDLGRKIEDTSNRLLDTALAYQETERAGQDLAGTLLSHLPGDTDRPGGAS